MSRVQLTLISILIINGFSFSQEKVSATFEALEGKVLIYFTIRGDADKEYEIDIVLKRTSDPSFELIPDEMSGDIGTGKYAGSRKTVIWNIKPDEAAQIDGEDFYFEVTATEIKEGGFPWLYVLGGAAVAGGAAAYFLLSGDKTDEETPDVATPPGRPQ